MALTSEKQKEYSVNKGGYSYYTLYRGVYDPTNGIDERPSYAETGDRFEPVDSDKVYVCTRRKGKATWAEDPNAQRQTETGDGGGGGVSSWNDLTDKPFYEETTAGINFTLDIDDPPAGTSAILEVAVEGAADPFELPFTAYRVGDPVLPAQVDAATVALSSRTDGQDEEPAYISVPAGTARAVHGAGFNAVTGLPDQGMTLLVFISVDEGSDESRRFVVYSDDGATTTVVATLAAGSYLGSFVMEDASGTHTNYSSEITSQSQTTVHKLDSKFYDKTQLPTGTNTGDIMTWGGSAWGAVPNPYTPLFVNVAPNQAGTALVGDKTYGEILAASLSGRTVIFTRGEQGATLAVDCGVPAESPGSVYVIAIIGQETVSLTGTSDQYPEITLG